MRNAKKLKIIISVIAVLVIALVVLIVLRLIQPNPSTHLDLSATQPTQSTPTLVDQATLATFPTKSASTVDVTRVGSGIIPPTNSWISGAILQSTPLAVYPMPLSFLAKDSGFEIGLPTVQSTSTVISGEHVPGIVANVEGATGFKLTRYDKISASLTYSNGSQALGALTLAEGSPYVFYHANATTTLTLTNIASTTSSSSSYLRYTSNGHSYAIDAGSGSSIKTNGATATIQANKGSLITFYGLPNGDQDTLRTNASNELKDVKLSVTQQKATSQTELTYETTNGKPTVFVPMSYSDQIDAGKSLGTYDSIYGQMTASQGNTFTLSVPLVNDANELDLSHLTDAHKQEIITNLKKDVASTTITSTNSYYAGKELARAATLLDISEQLHQDDTSAQLKTILDQAFSTRLNPDYFYYDSTLKGVAADTKAFGSEDFNDHHFHYGYFIYAASIYGKYDASFVQKYQKQVDLLVADIASYSTTSDFPLDRYYDPYAEHSWAAGLAPFSDGNNQESSSEALNAWNGVAEWAQLTHNTPLTTSASWMLSNEAATAQSSWRDITTDASYLKNYTSPLTSLNFGGKRTYSTFFSNDANAKLGIQLLPMSPVMLGFASDGSAIDRLTNSAISNDNFNVALGDYILMYSALSDPQKAANNLGKQQDSFIDDGNSRTYMDAWVYSLTDK